MDVLRFEKAPSDVRVYAFDFQHFAEIISGDTISSATITSPAGITVQTPTVVGAKVNAQISGGTGTAAGTAYRLKINATLASSKVLVGFADVVVIDPA